MSASDDWHYDFNLEVRVAALSPTLANHPLKLDARTAAIIDWMLVRGDLRPLAEALPRGRRPRSIPLLARPSFSSLPRIV